MKPSQLLNPFKQRCAPHICIILLRYLIGFAFIPSGLTKLAGQRFTRLSTDNPVGAYFEAMYQTGWYWNFLGAAQLVAAFLLMTQRYATLGAVLFFTIIVNIWAITVSIGFSGTWIITTLMLLATLLLLLWDWEKIRVLLIAEGQSVPAVTSVQHYQPLKAWSWLGLFLFFFFITMDMVFRYTKIYYINPPMWILVMALFAFGLIGAVLLKEIGSKKNLSSVYT